MTKAATNVDLLNWLETNQSALAALLGGGVVPIGTVIDFAAGVIPAGWLICDGQAVPRADYAALFAAIGVVWGAGDGSTTFNLPDFRRRTAVGSGGVATGTLGNTRGSVGGAETHTLTVPEMPSHQHSLQNFVTSQLTVGGVTGFWVPAAGSVLTDFTGGNGAHNNMQPSAVVLKIIRAF